MSKIISASVTTRDGDTLYPRDAAAYIAARHQQSERQRMLASVARIEARLQLQRELGRKAPSSSTPRVDVFEAQQRLIEDNALHLRADTLFSAVICALAVIAAGAALWVAL